MRAADVASVIAALALAGGAAGAFFWWQGEQAREELRRYEAGVDELIDNKIEAVGLADLRAQLAGASDPAAALQALYAVREQSDQLNLGFGTLQGDWRTSYANYAEEAGRVVEADRFEREVDERWGAGAFALMRAQYDAFLADAPRRQAEEDARHQRETQEMVRALDEYYRRNGHHPPGAFKIENGRVVDLN
ncbi:MAG TPA: hypothetical protein VEA80_06410 [Vitreimonas sp.]|uniref:hypothetical protein n=1 Tax=Vitreimonas sp. TaxID=3069702 RepID=UPI002D3AEF1B|nr:hypothetical protein [Vitreimonas sp.]HYD87086.1 hypothetical protein [Vitreimonas sp.]